MPDELDDFGLPGRSLDDFLSEEFEAREEKSTDATPESTDCSSEIEQQDSRAPQGCSTDVEPTSDPIVHALDEDRELTLYGAMLVAVSAATDALADKTLTPQADAFRAYLADLRKELYR
jgi:hypothetical protein